MALLDTSGLILWTTQVSINFLEILNHGHLSLPKTPSQKLRLLAHRLIPSCKVTLPAKLQSLRLQTLQQETAITLAEQSAVKKLQLQLIQS